MFGATLALKGALDEAYSYDRFAHCESWVYDRYAHCERGCFYCDEGALEEAYRYGRYAHCERGCYYCDEIAGELFESWVYAQMALRGSVT